MYDLTGRTLRNRYRIEGLIGRGGMADVYKAWDIHRQYHVAIKVMREDLAEDIEFVRRFRREAQALATLSHANIVRFYSFEQSDLVVFIVMDYIDGTTLRSEIARAAGPMPLERVVQIVRQVASGIYPVMWTLSSHAEVIKSVTFAPDGRSLVTGSNDGTISLWGVVDAAGRSD